MASVKVGVWIGEEFSAEQEFELIIDTGEDDSSGGIATAHQVRDALLDMGFAESEE